MSVAFSAFSVERAPSPAAFDLAFGSALLNPQPTIVFRPSHQPSPHRILSDVLHLLLKALHRTQDVIKRLLLPDRPRAPQRPVQAVRGRRFNPLSVSYTHL